MYTPFHFELAEFPRCAAALRERVRDFVKSHSGRWTPWQKGHSWTAFDRAFSQDVAREGWIGMTWPKTYGGSERTMLERYVVIEELLAAGAPLAAHWIGDRQSGPLLLRVGTEAQRRRFLPAIVKGEIAFCIGLSEPDSGSDLASVRTRADKLQEGWRITGQKIWTTNAHLSDFMIALVRTEGTSGDRQSGLSQFIIDLSLPGVTIREIRDMTMESHFNEVIFDNVLVKEDALVGLPGHGWEQVNAELAFERSGPDRYLSTFPIFVMLLDALQNGGLTDRLASRSLGNLAAEVAVLREMSASVAEMLDRGETPNQEAALVKDLGVSFEQRTIDVVRGLVGPVATRDSDDALREISAALLQLSPTFSLRGGTREIIRGILAKGLGLR